MAEVFSRAWAEEWCLTLNGTPAYRSAAATWEGSVALVMARDGSPKSPRCAVFMDLWHGECRAARVATETDLESATFVLAGSAANWRDLLTGRIAPLMAMMGGKIRLTRGSMAALLPYAAAAKELIAAAIKMESTFPDGWG